VSCYHQRLVSPGAGDRYSITRLNHGFPNELLSKELVSSRVAPLKCHSRRPNLLTCDICLIFLAMWLAHNEIFSAASTHSHWYTTRGWSPCKMKLSTWGDLKLHIHKSGNSIHLHNLTSPFLTFHRNKMYRQDNSHCHSPFSYFPSLNMLAYQSIHRNFSQFILLWKFDSRHV
jgi:hypothetical protein